MTAFAHSSRGLGVVKLLLLAALLSLSTPVAASDEDATLAADAVAAHLRDLKAGTSGGATPKSTGKSPTHTAAPKAGKSTKRPGGGQFNCEKAKEVTREILRSVVYPTAFDIVAGSILPEGWAANVKGRVHPVGSYSDRESTIEYFYALSIGDALANSGVPSPDSQVLLDIDIQFMTCDHEQKKVVWSALFKSGFVEDAAQKKYKLDGNFIPATSIFSFNENVQVCSFDQTLSRLGLFVANTGFQDPINTATNSLGPIQQAAIETQAIGGICGGIQAICTGDNQQYDDITDCVSFMKTLRFGGFDNADQNTVVCRQLHLILSPIRPDIHCPHVGKDGGGKCTDKALPALYETDFLTCDSEPPQEDKLGSGMWHGFLVPDAQTQTAPPVGSLPITAAEAESLGWVYDNTSPENEDLGFRWIKSGEDDNYPFALYFSSKYGLSDAHVSGLIITGPEVQNGAGTTSITVPGSESIGNGLIAYELKFSLAGDSLKIGNVNIPMTAEEAENQGWIEDSCFEPMGGTHFVPPDTTNYPTIAPLYDKYGDGRIKSIALAFGSDGIIREEFDLGGMETPGGLTPGCIFTHCEAVTSPPGACLISAGTNGNPKLTALHFYFSDPTPTFNGAAYPIATCQLYASSPCFQLGFSCCGARGDSVAELLAHQPPLP